MFSVVVLLEMGKSSPVSRLLQPPAEGEGFLYGFKSHFPPYLNSFPVLAEVNKCWENHLDVLIFCQTSGFASWPVVSNIFVTQAESVKQSLFWLTKLFSSLKKN